MSEPSPNLPTTTTNSVAPSPGSDRRKPRISLAIATAFGLGYLPKAPGTFGSLGGVAISLGTFWLFSRKTPQLLNVEKDASIWTAALAPGFAEYALVVLIAILGVYVANRAAKYAGKKDPQFVVIDEVSGQLIAYFSPFYAVKLEKFVAGLYTFSGLRYLEAVPCAASRIAPRRLGNHGG